MKHTIINKLGLYLNYNARWSILISLGVLLISLWQKKILKFKNYHITILIFKLEKKLGFCNKNKYRPY